MPLGAEVQWGSEVPSCEVQTHRGTSWVLCNQSLIQILQNSGYVTNKCGTCITYQVSSTEDKSRLWRITEETHDAFQEFPTSDRPFISRSPIGRRSTWLPHTFQWAFGPIVLMKMDLYADSKERGYVWEMNWMSSGHQ